MRGIASTASASVRVELSMDGGVGIVIVLGQSLVLSAGTPAIAPWISWGSLAAFRRRGGRECRSGSSPPYPFEVVIAGSGEHHLPLLVFPAQLGHGSAVLPTSDNDPFIAAWRT
jgi:hypothetical protein